MLHLISLSVLTAIFPRKPGLAGFIGTKDNVSGGDNWSYKTCKAPDRTSLPTHNFSKICMISSDLYR